jgi:hypothetical protein
VSGLRNIGAFRSKLCAQKLALWLRRATRLLLAAKYPAKTRDFGSISCKKASIFARIPSFSPRFNRQVAPRADAKRAPGVVRACANHAPEKRVNSER